MYNITKCSLGNTGGRLSDGFWRMRWDGQWEEKAAADKFSRLGANKLQFHDYCMAIPVIAQAVDFSVRVQAAIKVAKDTGDDGHRLLSSASTGTCPGASSMSQTRQTMYVSYETSSCRSPTVRGAPRWTCSGSIVWCARASSDRAILPVHLGLLQQCLSYLVR